MEAQPEALSGAGARQAGIARNLSGAAHVYTVVDESAIPAG